MSVFLTRDALYDWRSMRLDSTRPCASSSLSSHAHHLARTPACLPLPRLSIAVSLGRLSSFFSSSSPWPLSVASPPSPGAHPAPPRCPPGASARPPRASSLRRPPHSRRRRAHPLARPLPRPSLAPRASRSRKVASGEPRRRPRTLSPSIPPSRSATFCRRTPSRFVCVAAALGEPGSHLVDLRYLFCYLLSQRVAEAYPAYLMHELCRLTLSALRLALALFFIGPLMRCLALYQGSELEHASVLDIVTKVSEDTSEYWRRAWDLAANALNHNFFLSSLVSAFPFPF